MTLPSRLLALLVLLPSLRAIAQAPASRQRLLDAHAITLTSGGGADNATNQHALEAVGTALRETNGYTVTDNPAKADLALQLFCDTKHTHGKTQHTLRLTISNPADHILLWTLTERVAGSSTTWGKHFETVATKLSLDLKNLASGPQSGL